MATVGNETIELKETTELEETTEETTELEETTEETTELEETVELNETTMVKHAFKVLEETSKVINNANRREAGEAPQCASMAGEDTPGARWEAS